MGCYGCGTDDFYGCTCVGKMSRRGLEQAYADSRIRLDERRELLDIEEGRSARLGDRARELFADNESLRTRLAEAEERLVEMEQQSVPWPDVKLQKEKWEAEVAEVRADRQRQYDELTLIIEGRNKRVAELERELGDVPELLECMKEAVRMVDRNAAVVPEKWEVTIAKAEANLGSK